MEPQPQQQASPILDAAWTHYARFDAFSKKRFNARLLLRRWIGIFSVLAILLALLMTTFDPSQYAILWLALKIILALTPILVAAIAVYGSRFLSNDDWLITQAGAEEIQKEIYIYRTILQNSPDRHTWLEKRLAEIQHVVSRGVGAELTIPPHEGAIPPGHSPDDPASDPGFQDLNGDEYFRYRVKHQLDRYMDRTNKKRTMQTRLQIFIILSGVAGALLAFFIPVWAVLAASLAAVLIGWQELRNLDATVRNDGKVIMELNILNDRWKKLGAEEQTRSEFFNMAQSAENILWSRNIEYIKAVQETLKEFDLHGEADIVSRAIDEARGLKQSPVGATVDLANKKQDEAEGILAKEASSDIVQAELAAMRQGMRKKAAGMKSALRNIAEEFSDVEVGRDTPPTVLNALLSRFPKSRDTKG